MVGAITIMEKLEARRDGSKAIKETFEKLSSAGGRSKIPGKI